MVAMSDGCPHAGIGLAYNFGWKWEDIAEFMRCMSIAGYTAKTLATMLIDEVNKEYGYQPGDDASACVVKIRKREPMNILFGPPKNRDDCDRMMSLFFSKEGKHIICGGQKWMPIVAASQSVKGNEREREFLLSWIDVVDYV